MERSLEGKVVIVAGAGTKGDGFGNGKASAVRFAREGASVLCMDQDRTAAEATADLIRSEGGEGLACCGDISDPKNCIRIVEDCIGRYGKLDVLHNNVGIPSMMDIIETPEDAWREIFDINVKGMFMMCKQAIPAMIRGGGGSIINVSSLASLRSFPDAAYSASKGAVNSLTMNIAGRYGRYGIRANALLLGYIDTPLARPAWANEKVREMNLKQVPMKRFGSPWEVADVAVFLASDKAAYITGAVIPVDGGLSISM
jgi:NAD(P)-dependent dehydrogenase (short-subunit alcohol dehydrogenase family)